MTIVVQLINMEYLYKKNHSYTDTTKQANQIVWKRIYMRPSFTFARGGRRGLSQERIYEDDQMVIFIKKSFFYSKIKNYANSKFVKTKFNIAPAGEWAC